MKYAVFTKTLRKLNYSLSKKTLLFIAVLIGAISLQAQSYVFVDIDATGNNDGSNWANAFVNLDTALANVGSIGDYVLVAEGTYKPGDGVDRNQRFTLPFNIFLIGGFDGTETSHTEADPKNNVTILSGDLLGNDNANIDSSEATRSDNSYTLIYTGSGGEISGFTIEGGHANNTTGSDTWKSGAAIYAANNIVHIYDCVFRNNYGVNHGTITFRAPSGYNSWTYIYRNEFYNNAGGDIIGSYKSNTVTYWCYMNIYNNLFHDNNTEDALIDIYNYHVSTNSFGDYSYKIYNNTFADNSFVDGAPIRIGYERNTTAQNTAALLIETVGNIFANNGANESVLFQSSLQNAANYESHTFYSNLIEANSPIDSTSLRATYPQIGGTVLGESPLFEDKANDDYRILACASPTNDLVSGQNSGLPATYLDKDFYGNPRTLGIATDIGHCEVQQEADPISIQQVGTTLEATTGFGAYNWFFTQPPYTQYSELTNVLTPTDGDGTYSVTVIDNDLCKARATYDFCSSVTVSIALVDEDLVATGTGGSEYTWYLNGTYVGDGGTYTPTSIGTYTVNHYLWDGVQVQGCSASSTYEITCDDMPDAVIIESNGVLSVDDIFETYQWWLDGTAISGANSATYTATQDGDYEVEVVGAFNCGTVSNTYSYCADVSVSISQNGADFTATSGFSAYQWLLDGTAISGATSETYTATQDGAYSCNATDNGCTGSSNTISYVGGTGIKDITFVQLNIHPNPTTGIVNIEVGNEEIASIRVFDLAGRIVKQYGNESQIDVSDINTGIYMLEIANEEKRSIVKLIVR